MPRGPLGEASEVSAALQHASQMIEAKFLRAGETLEQAIDIVGELIGSLDQVAAALDPDTVDNTTRGLTAAATQLTALSTAHQGRRARLENLGATGRTLGQLIVDMRRSLSYVRVFAINIRITAGGIPQAGADFADFAREIYASIEQGGQQLNEFADDLADLAEQVDVALRHELALEDRCGDMLPALRSSLEADAAAIASHHNQMASMGGGASGLARRVQDRVASVIGALQVGDSTRQRIEHGQAALAMVERLDLNDRARARLTDEVGRLVAAQLEDTAQTFRHDVEHIAASLDGIADDAAEILRLRDHARSGEGSGDGGFLRRLEVSVDTAMNLVGEVHDAEQTAREIGRSAQAAAAGLETRIMSIQAIRAEIQQMALNANLKCGRMGDPGRPLSVIAIEMRSHAGLLDETAVGTEAVLRNLTGRPASLDSGPVSEAVAAADIGGILADAAERLRKAGDLAGADLGSLAAHGDAVVDTLRQAKGRLNLQDEVGQVLEQAAEALWPDGDIEPPDADDEDFAAAREALMAGIAKLYTMSREREIHRSVIPDGTAAAPPLRRHA
jgi:hypothetical protein